MATPEELLKLLNNIDQNTEETVEGERFLIIDGLNLFFRNFAILNMVNPQGVHIGGLGGFFRSLGALIRKVQPTQVYVIFDGAGSSNARKNIISEYKSGRNIQRITNWDAFDNLEEENDAKIDQMVRVIQYLKTLPVKTLTIDKVEADDIIAFLTTILPKHEKDKAFIVSSDKDFLQLVNPNVAVYRPMEKKFYTTDVIKEKFNMPASNFIIYKTLMGDNSDKIKGVKGLGEKKLRKLFPEISEKEITLEDIFDICEAKLGEHIIYARVLQHRPDLEKSYQVMDLSNPMLSNQDKEYLQHKVDTNEHQYLPEQFLEFYRNDGLGGIIRNVEFWVQDVFEQFKL